LCKLSPGLYPSLHNIRKRRNEINELIEIKKLKNGVYTSIKEKIDYRVSAFEEYYEFEESIRIKISSDGTKFNSQTTTTHSIKVCITFSILNEVPICNSASGTYLLGIFDVDSENYENLIEPFNILKKDLENLRSIKVKGKEKPIEFYFCGDLKATAIILGINHANSNYPCPWCEYIKPDFYYTK
jgi:hypothetical protein